MPAGPGRLLATPQFVQIGDDVIARQSSFFDRNQNFSSLGECGFVCIDVEASALDAGRVDLSRVRLKCSDSVDVGARTQESAVEQGLVGSRASADHVGFGDQLASVDYCPG